MKALVWYQAGLLLKKKKKRHTLGILVTFLKSR